MLLICDAGEDPWESLGQQGDQTSPSILMEINSENSLEGLKLWCFGHWCRALTLGKAEGRRRRGWQRLRQLDGTSGSMDEFEQALGDCGGPRSLGCCSPRGREDSDMTQIGQHFPRAGFEARSQVPWVLYLTLFPINTVNTKTVATGTIWMSIFGARDFHRSGKIITGNSLKTDIAIEGPERNLAN